MTVEGIESAAGPGFAFAEPSTAATTSRSSRTVSRGQAFGTDRDFLSSDSKACDRKGQGQGQGQPGDNVFDLWIGMLKSGVQRIDAGDHPWFRSLGRAARVLSRVRKLCISAGGAGAGKLRHRRKLPIRSPAVLRRIDRFLSRDQATLAAQIAFDGGRSIDVRVIFALDRLTFDRLLTRCILPGLLGRDLACHYVHQE